MIFLDTNVLIEILKNNKQTLSKVLELGSDLSISSITAMELLYGARDKRELKELHNFTAMFNVAHVDTKISAQALGLVAKFAKSHSLDIPDAFIAATCINRNAELYTYNKKDFRFIPGLNLIKL